jgi:hypothetical protein
MVVMDNVDLKDYLEKISAAKSAEKYNNDSYTRYNDFFNGNCLPSEDSQALTKYKRQTFTFNELKPVINAWVTQLHDAAPTTQIQHDTFDQLADFLNEVIKNIFEENNYRSFIATAGKESITCSKSVWKASTEYKNNRDFEQKIKIEVYPDPRRIYFDPDAEKLDKSDASYVVEVFYLSGRQLKEYFPDVISEEESFKNESYELCNLYEYEITYKTIYLLDDATITDKKPQDKKSIKTSRKTEKKRVVCRTFYNEKIIDEQVLNGSFLPFIQVTADAYRKGKKIINQSYISAAMDAQRTKNLMANCFLSDSFTKHRSTIMVGESGWTKKTEEVLTNPDTQHVLVYKDFKDDGIGNLIPVSPPQIIPAPPVPAEFLTLYENMSKTIDKITGSFQQHILNSNDISGVGLYKLSHWISSVLRPFLINLLEALRSLTICVLSMYQDLKSPQELGFDEEEHIDPNDFNYVIKEGVNFKLQQEATVETILKVGQISPSFSRWIDQEGITFLLENLDLNHKDDVLKSYEQYSQQQKMQPPQPSPADIIAQADLIKAKSSDKVADAKVHEIALASQNSVNTSLANINKENVNKEIQYMKLQLDAQKQQNENFRALLKELMDKLNT